MKSSLFWILVVYFSAGTVPLLENATDATELQHPTVSIEGQEGKIYPSLQEALDEAMPGAVVKLSAGRFNERVTIKQPVRLVGAGADATILGPTIEEQTERGDKIGKLYHIIDSKLRAAEEARPRRELSIEETEDVKRKYEEIKRLVEVSLQPVIQIENADSVELHNLRVTMPLTPHEGSGLQVTGAITISKARVRLVEVAIIGCMSEGVRVTDASHLDIIKSLIAGCWGTGVTSSHPDSEVKLNDCDIRNNYHYNIALSSNACEIEGCRISGTAWSGISCGGKSPRIVRNAIFNNRGGVYEAGSEGVVKNNLFYQNHAAASCWSSNHPLYEGNLFLENRDGAVYVNGPGEPRFRNNLFVASPMALHYGSMKIARGELPPPENFHFDGNVFWQIDTPVMLHRTNEYQGEPLSIQGISGNPVADPHVMIDNQRRLVFQDDELVARLELNALQGITLESRWPLTAEELAMIPDDGSVDSAQWKMRPRLKEPR